jgi:tetratricopeptide (TPR) repeat protein
MGDAARESLRALFSKAKALPPDAVRQIAALAQEMVTAGKSGAAEEVLRGLLPLAESRAQREILLALGRIAESGTRFQAAADYYLRSAYLAGKVPDALAVQARLAAALNLAQAGNREDARAQLQWLLKNASDPAQLEVVKRELAKL